MGPTHIVIIVNVLFLINIFNFSFFKYNNTTEYYDIQLYLSYSPYIHIIDTKPIGSFTVHRISRTVPEYKMK